MTNFSKKNYKKMFFSRKRISDKKNETNSEQVWILDKNSMSIHQLKHALKLLTKMFLQSLVKGVINASHTFPLRQKPMQNFPANGVRDLHILRDNHAKS